MFSRLQLKWPQSLLVAVCVFAGSLAASCAERDSDAIAVESSPLSNDVPTEPAIRPLAASAGFDMLFAEAQSSPEVADAVGFLQQAGWIGGDFATATVVQDNDESGALAIGLPFHYGSKGIADIVYTEVPDAAGHRATVRPRDADSAALLDTTSGKADPSLGAGDDPTAVNVAASVPGPTRCGYLLPNQGLNPGQTLRSCNNGYRLTLQFDGNLVAYNAHNAVVWASGTNRNTPRYLIMQGDGNLVIYFTNRSPWSTHTNGRINRPNDTIFRLQDDGNLVVYVDQGTGAVWSSDTWCGSSCTGNACRFWDCVYVSRIGTNTRCFALPGNPAGENPLGAFFVADEIYGHTNPGQCHITVNDYKGRTYSCPSSGGRHVAILRCGFAPT
jgi:hypothetical protein